MKRLLSRLLSRGRPLLGWAIVAALASGATLPAAEPAAESALKSPVPTKRVAPVHPAGMLSQFINGRATVECLITETGEVKEVKTLSASQPEFGRAAEDAVRQWEFHPGERAGHPVAVRLQIPFDFTLTTEQVLEGALGRTIFKEINELIIPAREMPAWPRPVQYLLPRYPESLKGSGKYGKAVVSIVINKEGKVMNPTILKATYPEFMLPALATAARLEFPPQVMANREHVNVSMDIQFDFKAESDKPKEKEKEKDKPKK